MDLDLNDEERTFRERTRGFVDGIDLSRWKSLTAELTETESDFWFPWCLTGHRLLAEQDMVGLGWPPPAGRQAPAGVEHIVNEELAYAGYPGRQFNAVAELILRYGSPGVVDYHLPRIRTGEIRYADCLSEPEAGSDLFALQTTALLDGEQYRLRGTKIWTSFAHVAQYLMVLARTDPALTRHRGLSLLLVAADAPGVTIEPIRVVGGWRLNICTFSDVAVPVANRLGPDGSASDIMRARLAQERSVSFGGAQTRLLLARLIHRLQRIKYELSAVDVAYLGELLTDLEVERLMLLALGAQVERGAVDTAAASRAKVFGSELAQRAAIWFLRIADDLRRTAGLADTDPLAQTIEQFARASATLTIAGGTSEMQRNAIASRGLGLPR